VHEKEYRMPSQILESMFLSVFSQLYDIQDTISFPWALVTSLAKSIANTFVEQMYYYILPISLVLKQAKGSIEM
jgi:hypothetical protein